MVLPLPPVPRLVFHKTIGLKVHWRLKSVYMSYEDNLVRAHGLRGIESRKVLNGNGRPIKSCF